MKYSTLASSNANPTRVCEAAQFADKYLTQSGENWDNRTESPEKVLREAIKLFTPITITKAAGGHGESFATLCEVYEQLANRDLGFTCALAVHTNVTTALSLSENKSLRDRYLPKLLAGEAVGAFLLTEPSVGSDATAIKTIAARKLDTYSITGQKAWITNGAYADVLVVFCQTEPGSGAQGVTAFAVDRDTNGVDIKPPLDLIGSGAMGTTDASFTSVSVTSEAIAFPAGQAFKAAMFGINVARLGVAAMCNGALTGALSHAIEYASDRMVFGQPLLKQQGMQWVLSDVATVLESSRSLTFQAAELFDKGEDSTLMAAHAKKLATKTSFDGISECMRAMGANGLKRSYPLARQLEACRVTECMDGTGEIMNIVIARSFLNRS